MKSFDNAFRVLLVNPETPMTYWGFQEAAWFVGARAAHIPLPLITVAALLPKEWQIRLVDMNVEELRDEDIATADAVLLTAMIIQKDSLRDTLERCARLGVPTVVGGPFVSSSPDAPELAGANALVIGEAEDDDVLGQLIADLQAQNLRSLYEASGKPAMITSPVPRYDLLRRGAYCALSLQVSRGCPHNCEFCNVRTLFGRVPRYKTPEQVTANLQAIYETGYRGNVFFVDDNFIGDLKAAKAVLEAVGRWQEERGRPFLFYTEADIRLAAKEDVVKLMVQAGFFAVFVGFESPSKAALKEASKTQNIKVDAVRAVHTLRQNGLLVYGGFIVGFDADGPEIFREAHDFIENCRIDFAMAGMLVAIPGTPLEQRMRAEGRLVENGVDTFADTNIVPRRLTRLELLRGYRWLMEKIYEPAQFFERAYDAVKEWKQGLRRRPAFRELLAVPRSILRQGIFSHYRRHYWRFMLRTLFRSPGKIARAFSTAISGHHFFRYTRETVLPGLQAAENRLLAEYPPMIERNVER